MLVKKVNGKQPTFGEGCFFAENATLTGDVHLGNRCTVWYNAVIRGDVNTICIGDDTNIQDGVVIHATYQTHPTTIGNRVSIGHNAIGMGSIVMDGCVVESHSIVAAGAVVPPNTHIEKGSLYAGVPAKKLKNITDEQKTLIERTALNYPKYASWIEK